PPTWMSQLMPLIGDRTLETICLPRSHDAGMYEPVQPRRLGTRSTTITQSKTIREQLMAGVRMFDLRPCIVRGEFYCSHGSLIRQSNIPDMAQYFIPDAIANELGYYSGAEGASLESIIYQVNEFTERFPGEVITLEVSHAFNYDREIRDEEWKHALDKTEWNRLFTALQKLNHLYISNQGARAPLTTVKIRDFVSSGHSAVIVAASTEPDAEFAGRGFF
ncbi:PLC-like phosphodiesterase, partial [Dactylonectria estremocensis]